MSHNRNHNVVPCLIWVSKGVSQPIPDFIQLSLADSNENDDMRKIDPCFEKDENLRDEEESNNEGKEVPNEDETTSNMVIDSDADITLKYDLDNYDDSDDDIPCAKIENLQMFPSNKEDANLADTDEDEKKEEEENNKIIPDDNLLVVGRYKEVGKDPLSIVIEVYVYNKRQGSFYVHHYMNLTAFPIALEWLDFNPSDEKRGSFVAVADTTGKIGVWNLDVDGQGFPDYTLERENMEEIKCLAWNKNLRNILASGYSDGMIVLWDLQTCQEQKVLTYHKHIVQAIAWDPFNARYLLSGCREGYVKLYDSQTNEDKPMKSWKVKGEIEKVCWSKALPSKFFCATDKGFVYSFDVDSGLEHRIKAHENCVTALDVSPDYPNLLMTASFDKYLKVWDLDQITGESNEVLYPIYRKKNSVGRVFTAKFAPDSELVVAFGGNSKANNLKLLDFKYLNSDLFTTSCYSDNNATSQDENSEYYGDLSSFGGTCNEKKKRKKKIKSRSTEARGSAPARKRRR